MGAGLGECCILFQSLPRERAGEAPRRVWAHVLRPRTLLYTALWALVGIGLVFALFIRPAVEVTVAPVRNPTYVTLSDGSIRNTYDLRLRNKNTEARQFRLSVSGDPALRVQLEGAADPIVGVPADTVQLMRVYVVSAPGTGPAAAASVPVRFWIEDLGNGDRAFKDTTFNGTGD